jgi:ferritin-like metal-binding protein YciE
MAGYMTAISLTHQIGADEVVATLKESLAEEEAADTKLTQIGATTIETAPSVTAKGSAAEQIIKLLWNL